MCALPCLRVGVGVCICSLAGLDSPGHECRLRGKRGASAGTSHGRSCVFSHLLKRTIHQVKPPMSQTLLTGLLPSKQLRQYQDALQARRISRAALAMSEVPRLAADRMPSLTHEPNSTSSHLPFFHTYCKGIHNIRLLLFLLRRWRQRRRAAATAIYSFHHD